MTSISADLLVRVTGCTRALANTWCRPLHEACRHYQIDTPARVAAFLAQIGHESMGLARTTENLNYSADALVATWPSRYTVRLAAQHARRPADIANHVYGGRLGNKDEGDGWKYRGRGLMQITGRGNYEAMRDLLREQGVRCPDFEADPDAVSEPRWAAMTAAAYWDSRALNDLADAGNFSGITRRINGGTNGQADRIARYERAKRALQAIA
jgi:putative chitinase